MSSASTFTWGLGRRKTSVARVRLAPGTGLITLNRKPLAEYVNVERLRKYLTTPLEVTQNQGKFDIHVNVDGGGITGQVGACVLGISRALIKAEPTTEPT